MLIIMTYEKYQAYYQEALKIKEDPDVFAAIKKQTELSEEAQKKAKIRYEIEDKLYELYHSIPADGIDDALFGGEDLPEHERMVQIMEMWMKNDPKLNIIKETMVKSGKDKEIGELERKLQDAIFDYFSALIKLDTAINESRQNLFSKEYKEKMKEYADNGVLLYFLETPDAPILSKEFTIDDVLESFTFGECISLKTLFYRFVVEDNPSPSMRRKTEDIVSAVNCLENREYRSAARTVFALLESEHKNCSTAMDNYFTLDKQTRKGVQRAEKIQQLLDCLKEQTYFSEVWNIVNPLYRDILNSKVESFIDRNFIIHGDYYSDKLDINEKDVVKLLLLFINMRMISDHVQLYCEMLRVSINYTEIHIAQQLKNKKD